MQSGQINIPLRDRNSNSILQPKQMVPGAMERMLANSTDTILHV